MKCVFYDLPRIEILGVQSQVLCKLIGQYLEWFDTSVVDQIVVAVLVSWTIVVVQVIQQVQVGLERL